MNTDTKAVARWDIESQDGRDCLYLSREDGDYVLFTDHDRVVGELAHLNFVKAEVIRDFVSDIETLRTALAASRAEVEELKSERDGLIELANRSANGIRKATGEYNRLRAEAEGLKRLLGETAQCLADVSNDVGGWAVEEVIESAMNAAMEKENV